jgi:endonuclease/exonuclease/phosphatase family metal-dependent hydrolase
VGIPTRLVAQVVALVLVVACLAALTARFIGDRLPGPWPELATLTPLAGFLAMTAAGLALAARSLSVTALAVLTAIPLCAATTPSPTPWTIGSSWGSGLVAADAGPVGAPSLTVMTLNSHVGTADAGQVVAAVRRHRVDVLAVQELTAPAVRRLHDAGLPTAVLPSVAGTFYLTPRIRVRLSSGTTVTVTAVHPTSPRPGRERRWQRDLALIHAAVASTEGPQLVLGDFNATRDHAGFRNLTDLGLTDAADTGLSAGRPGATWPAAPGIWPLLRLDHVLFSSDGLTANGTTTFRVSGSDHRAVVAGLHAG